MVNLPHDKRRGWLKNGNPVGDYSKAPRCGAKTRRGTLCQQPAMKNGRCRPHGGKSTGAKTPEGRARAQVANWKHGFYSAGLKQCGDWLKIASVAIKQYCHEIYIRAQIKLGEMLKKMEKNKGAQGQG